MTLPPDVPAPSEVEAIHVAVLGWYRANARPLAFRGTIDPWAILVSEYMAQQTQAARAAERWREFMAAYPTPGAFAAASPADALRAWRGLGYNRRAIALQRAARAIVQVHGGRVPSDLEALQRLPGVGPYTARAVASLAFGLPVGAVDTNVRRVVGRAFLGESPTAKDIQATADDLVPPTAPGEWTHALMDVGATFCRPRTPRCEACPIRPWCGYAAAREVSDVAPAAVVSGSRPRSGSEPRFDSTSRWLRGRILDRLLDAADGTWVAFDGAIGGHEIGAIRVALAAMAVDGLIEVRGERGPEARLPAG